MASGRQVSIQKYTCQEVRVWRIQVDPYATFEPWLYGRYPSGYMLASTQYESALPLSLMAKAPLFLRRGQSCTE